MSDSEMVPDGSVVTGGEFFLIDGKNLISGPPVCKCTGCCS